MKADFTKRLSNIEDALTQKSLPIEPIIFGVNDCAANGGKPMPILGWRISRAELKDKTLTRRKNESEKQLWNRVEKYMDKHGRKKWVYTMMQVVKSKPHESVRVTKGNSRKA